MTPFDLYVAKLILEAIGANVNADGFILNKEGKYFPSINNQPVSIYSFAGIVNKNGESLLVNNDLVSIIEAAIIIDNTKIIERCCNCRKLNNQSNCSELKSKIMNADSYVCNKYIRSKKASKLKRVIPPLSAIWKDWHIER
jgi:hypothetical protein